MCSCKDSGSSWATAPLCELLITPHWRMPKSQQYNWMSSMSGKGQGSSMEVLSGAAPQWEKAEHQQDWWGENLLSSEIQKNTWHQVPWALETGQGEESPGHSSQARCRDGRLITFDWELTEPVSRDDTRADEPGMASYSEWMISHELYFPEIKNLMWVDLAPEWIKSAWLVNEINWTNWFTLWTGN